MVVQFRSDNPGYWLFHCHNEIHRSGGMSLIIREDIDNIKSPPEEMGTCNSFIWDVHDFMASLEEERGSCFVAIPSILTSSFMVMLGMLY